VRRRRCEYRAAGKLSPSRNLDMSYWNDCRSADPHSCRPLILSVSHALGPRDVSPQPLTSSLLSEPHMLSSRDRCRETRSFRFHMRADPLPALYPPWSFPP